MATPSSKRPSKCQIGMLKCAALQSIKWGVKMLLDKSKFVSELGVKASPLSGWMQRHWEKGIHYNVIGHTTMIDTKEFDQWIRNSQQASDLAETSLILESPKDKKSRTRILFRQNRAMRLTSGAKKAEWRDKGQDASWPWLWAGRVPHPLSIFLPHGPRIFWDSPRQTLNKTKIR